MKKLLLLLLGTAGIIAIGRNSATSQTDRADFRAGEIGRFQIVAVGDARVYLLDTATGQCWTRSAVSGDWRDAGNPTRRPARGDRRGERESGEVSLKLPSETVRLSIFQREERAIPGSNGSVRIHLGDVTDGQAFLTVVTSDRQTLLDRTSVTEDDSAYFTFDGKKYEVRIREMRNVLIGDDFVTVEISEDNRAEAAAKAPERPTREN
jgi:hypothetical protein